MKILHTGDLHLDSPFSKLDLRRAEERRRECRETFASMIEYVKENSVDLLLMTGDLFDTGFVTRETLAVLRRGFSQIPACKVVISPGNHDPFTEKSAYSKAEFPSNVYVFKTGSLCSFEFDDLNADVYGYAFTAPTMPKSPFSGQCAKNLNRINILSAHGDITCASEYCPLGESALCRFGFAYVALGHIHNAPEIRRADNTCIAYCGCPEARSFDETGIKGAVLVNITKEGTKPTVSCERIRFSRRRYESAAIALDGISSNTEVEAKLFDLVQINGYGEDTLLRVEFTGNVAPDLVIDVPHLKEMFSSLYYIDIKDSTVPLFNMEYLRSDPTVRGEFCRCLLPDIEGGDAEKRETASLALKYGLAALSGEKLADIE